MNFVERGVFMTMFATLYPWKIFLLTILIVVLGGLYYVVCKATADPTPIKETKKTGGQPKRQK